MGLQHHMKTGLILTFRGRFNPGFDHYSHPVSHRFTLPGILRPMGFYLGFGQKGENVTQSVILPVSHLSARKCRYIGGFTWGWDQECERITWNNGEKLVKRHAPGALTSLILPNIAESGTFSP